MHIPIDIKYRWLPIISAFWQLFILHVFIHSFASWREQREHLNYNEHIANTSATIPRSDSEVCFHHKNFDIDAGRILHDHGGQRRQWICADLKYFKLFVSGINCTKMPCYYNTIILVKPLVSCHWVMNIYCATEHWMMFCAQFPISHWVEWLIYLSVNYPSLSYYSPGLPCYVKNMARGTQVDKNRGRRPRFLSWLRPEGHVFNIAWQTMIKTYYSMFPLWFNWSVSTKI